MDTTTSLPTPIASSAPRRRWWLRATLMLLALAIVAPLSLFGYLNYAIHSNWAQAEAETDQSDPHWRFADLLAQREPIAEKDNSALHIIAVARQVKVQPVFHGPNYDLVFKDLPPTAQLNSQQYDLLGSELAKINKPLKEARRLKDMPRGRFSIKYADDYISTLIPEHDSAGSLARWLMQDANLLAHEQKLDEAVESCQASMNTGRVMADDLFLISHMLRIGIQTRTIITLERVLAQGTATDPALQAMQALIEKETKEANWLHAARGERAGSLMLFENIRSGKLRAGYLRGQFAGRSPENLSEWVADKFPSTMLNSFPDHLRHMTECVELAKLPLHEQRPKIVAWDEKTRAAKNAIITMMTPRLSKVYQTDCRSQAHLRTALVALACERYRLVHGNWPKSLEVLVKEKLLDAVPRDPIDGQPLRYRRTNDSIVIYSIGLDEVDNEGRIDRDQAATAPGFDLGFRLWNPEQRRGPPRPVVALGP